MDTSISFVEPDVELMLGKKVCKMPSVLFTPEQYYDLLKGVVDSFQGRLRYLLGFKTVEALLMEMHQRAVEYKFDQAPAFQVEYSLTGITKKTRVTWVLFNYPIGYLMGDDERTERGTNGIMLTEKGEFVLVYLWHREFQERRMTAHIPVRASFSVLEKQTQLDYFARMRALPRLLLRGIRNAIEEGFKQRKERLDEHRSELQRLTKITDWIEVCTKCKKCGTFKVRGDRCSGCDDFTDGEE